jgi:hypothetical protein
MNKPIYFTHLPLDTAAQARISGLKPCAAPTRRAWLQ